VDMGAQSRNSALFLEGVVFLGAVSGNATLKALANDVAISVLLNHAFQDSITGILFGSGGTGYLMRALYPIYTLNSDNSTIQELVSAFISTQYNALMDFASDGNDNYAGDLNGPGFVPFSFTNETRAIYVLLGGIVIDSPLNDSSPIPQPPPGSGASSSKHAPVGAIVGGAVGGGLVLALVILLGFMFRKRRRRRALSSEQRLDAYDGLEHTQNAYDTEGTASPVTQLPSKREREAQRFPASLPSPSHPTSSQGPATTISGTTLALSSNAGGQGGRDSPPANARRLTAPDETNEQNAVTEVLVGLLNQRLREQQPTGSLEVLEPPPVYDTVLRASGRTTPT